MKRDPGVNNFAPMSEHAHEHEHEHEKVAEKVKQLALAGEEYDARARAQDTRLTRE